MSVAKSVIWDGGQQRAVQQGDVVAAAEAIIANVTVGASTLTAAMLLAGILNRSGSVAGYIDTTDSSANIIAGMVGPYGYNTSPQTGISSGNAVQQGTTVRLRILNTVAFIETMAAGTGVTLAGITANAATSWRDYLIIVTNGTPQQVFAANQVNASAVITGLNQFQTSQLSVGMLVSGTNIPAATTILSIQPGIGVTLSAAATATLALNALTFNPTVTIQGLGGGAL